MQKIRATLELYRGRVGRLYAIRGNTRPRFTWRSWGLWLICNKAGGWFESTVANIPSGWVRGLSLALYRLAVLGHSPERTVVVFGQNNAYPPKITRQASVTRYAQLWRVSFCLLAFLSSCIAPDQPASRSAPPSDRGSIFLPIISRPVPTSPLPTPTLDPIASCFSNPKALAFYRLLIADSRQQRQTLTCFPALVASAKQRAMGLASVDPWAHVDKDGMWPNEYARRAGCRLPVSYGVKVNNIESLAAGSGNVEVIYNSLANSPGHSDHLFGRGAFFGAQRHIGIGYAEGGARGFYWVIHIANCEGVTSGE